MALTPEAKRLHDQFAADHGGSSGAPRPLTSPDDYKHYNSDAIQADGTVLDPYYEYRFGDGSVLVMNGAGQILDLKPAKPAAADGRPPQPAVSPTAEKVPEWNQQTGKWDWIDNPAKAPPTTPEPKNVQTQTDKDGAVWERNPQTGQWTKVIEGKGTSTTPEVRVVGDQLVEYDPTTRLTRVLISKPTSPEKPTTFTAKDGTLWQWNAQGNTWTKAIEGQGDQPTAINAPANQENIVLQNGSEITSRPNPNYRDQEQQVWSIAQKHLAQIDAGVAAGTFSPEQAASAKASIQARLDAALRGMTPAEAASADYQAGSLAATQARDAETRQNNIDTNLQAARGKQATLLGEQSKAAASSLMEMAKAGTAPIAGISKAAIFSPLDQAMQIINQGVRSGEFSPDMVPTPRAPVPMGAGQPTAPIPGDPNRAPVPGGY